MLGEVGPIAGVTSISLTTIAVHAPQAGIHHICPGCPGFPPFDHAGFKIGKFGHLGETADPDRLDREVNAADEACLREAVTEYFPLAGVASTFDASSGFECQVGI